MEISFTIENNNITLLDQLIFERYLLEIYIKLLFLSFFHNIMHVKEISKEYIYTEIGEDDRYR